MKIAFLRTIAILFCVVFVRTAMGQATVPTPDPVLESQRKRIDSLDQRLFEILGAREQVVEEIGLYKAQKNIPSLQAARFHKVLEKGIEAGKKEGLSETFVTELLNAIHKESLRIEDELKSQRVDLVGRGGVDGTQNDEGDQ